jgi:hypothetical protein
MNARWIAITSCRHAFCRECLGEWLNRQVKDEDNHVIKFIDPTHGEQVAAFSCPGCKTLVTKDELGSLHFLGVEYRRRAQKEDASQPGGSSMPPQILADNLVGDLLGQERKRRGATNN